MNSADRKAIRIQRNSLFLLALGMSVILSCAPKQTSAPKRIVFYKLENGKNTNIRKKVAQELKSDFEVVPNQKFRRTAKKLKIKKLEVPKNIAKVCKKLKLDMVIWGTANKKKKTTKIALNIIDAKDGQTVDVFRTKIKTKRISIKKSKSIAKGLSLKLNAFFLAQEAKKKRKKKKDKKKDEDEDENEDENEDEDEPKKKKKRKKKKKKREEPEEDFDVEFKMDESGQAIDDEMPL